MKIVNINSVSKKDNFEDFLNWLQDDLNSVNKLILENLTNSSSLISDLSNHIINSGGKRIRPLLTLAVAKLCGYTGSRHLILASVIEYIHTATLLHDDVVDNSRKRRGKKTANFVWGNKSSILVGDFLLSKAFGILISDGSIKCIGIISKASEKISLGEVKQLMSIKKLEISESEYLDIISSKTAELFSAACQISGEISEISTEMKNSLKDFGRFLGISFQIVDDTLDYFSENSLLGKEIGNDLFEGKMTLPLILLYKRSNNEEKKLLQRIISKDKLNNNDFKNIVFSMNNYGIKNDCLNKARHFSLMAKDSLGLFPDSSEKQKIINLIDHLLSRIN